LFDDLEIGIFLSLQCREDFSWPLDWFPHEENMAAPFHRAAFHVPAMGPYPYRMLPETERSQLSPPEVARLDAEDRQYDEPGYDWEQIAMGAAPASCASPVMSLEEFIRVTTEDAERMAKMTARDLDHVIANDGHV
jgi:hypothetical protein